MKHIFEYSATVHRVIDGDTYELDIDLGFNVFTRVPVRLRGLDCPESHTPEGVRATADANFELSRGPITIQTFKDHQSFARWIADVWVGGVSLADILRKAGHVKVKP